MNYKDVTALIAGATATGLLLSAYFGLYFLVPSAGEFPATEYGWKFSIKYFGLALPYALVASLVFFFVFGPLVYWFLIKIHSLNYWVVGFLCTTLGVLNPFLHGTHENIPYSFLVFTLGAVSILVGATISLSIVRKHRINNFHKQVT